MSAFNHSRDRIRVGVFYDGSFFSKVSDFYKYHDSRRARICIAGFHDVLRKAISDGDGVPAEECELVEKHYFRGRFATAGSTDVQRLIGQRRFEDVLVAEGVQIHNLPMSVAGKEKGVDIQLALKVCESVDRGRLDVVALVSGDGDFAPLILRLKQAGARVLVPFWDLHYKDRAGQPQTTATSRKLLEEATYGLMMSSFDEKRGAQPGATRGLFLEPSTAQPSGARVLRTNEFGEPSRHDGIIKVVYDRENKRFGFIRESSNGDDVFFGERYLEGVEFSDLSHGDRVSFELGENSRGACAKRVRIL
jgi:uncharacterized LabA/DUF88 family protein/cold shock CspA family protein